MQRCGFKEVKVFNYHVNGGLGFVDLCIMLQYRHIAISRLKSCALNY